MGFDTGLMLANLLFAYFSQPGRKNDEQYSLWILNNTVTLFESFENKFISLWNEKEAAISNGSSDVSQAELLRAYPTPASPPSTASKKSYLQAIWSDTLGFAGAELIRRIVGIAHVEDLDGIADLELRSHCEKRCLLLARHFILMASQTSAAYEDAAVLPLVRRPQDLRQVAEAVNKLDINQAMWP